MPPKEIVAKRKGPCRKCKTWIKEGDQIRCAKDNNEWWAEHITCPKNSSVEYKAQSTSMTTADVDAKSIWDEYALICLKSLAPLSGLAFDHRVETACKFADAMMAERTKRIGK